MKKSNKSSSSEESIFSNFSILGLIMIFAIGGLALSSYLGNPPIGQATQAISYDICQPCPSGHSVITGLAENGEYITTSCVAGDYYRPNRNPTTVLVIYKDNKCLQRK